jgi:hypothetical protein
MNFMASAFRAKTTQGLLPVEKRTFRLHLWYTIFDNFVLGVLALNEFVFLRSVNGTSLQLSFLFQFSVVVFLLLIFTSAWLSRVSDKPRLVRRAGIITRAPLALLLFFPHSEAAMLSNSWYHIAFLLIFFIYYLGNPVLFPTINLLLKKNYRHEHFSRLYSYSTLWGKVVMLVVVFLYGVLLDYDKYAYTWVFFLAAMAGVAAVILLSRIPYEAVPGNIPQSGILDSVRESIARMRSIMKQNTPFRHFELGFMFYGFGFMSTVTVITIFFEKELSMNYFTMATYKNSYNIIALFLIPFFGRVLGRIDPRKFGAITFASVMCYLLSLVLANYFPQKIVFGNFSLFYSLIPYLLFHSIFAATMSLLWSIGSAYFCTPDEAGDYQSVHLFLTAFRSLFAPLLGVLFYQKFGFVFTFAMGAAMLAMAVVVMIWSYKTDQNRIKL